jgi:hypothetical protein
LLRKCGIFIEAKSRNASFVDGCWLLVASSHEFWGLETEKSHMTIVDLRLMIIDREKKIRKKQSLLQHLKNCDVF